ncbi:MAG: peptidoglycan editing factor PgeF [Myxococcales bacterium]|nr:peptidoglycan editing factor PgeF [Myxococcales bacterium]
MTETSESHEIVARAPRLRDAGFAHGFSTRRGGVSEAPFDTMNLGRAVGDDLDHVRENHTRLARSVGYEAARLFERSQVHGAAVFTAREGDQPERVRDGQSDALVTAVPGFAVGVRVADCVPVLIADPVSGAVAAVHAGWRGVVAGVVGASIESLAALGVEPSNAIAAIGPSIGPCCFEVGEDVASAIAEASGDGVVLRRGPQKPHVDLWRAVERQLHRAGVKTIDTLGACTMCEPETWFSFRRDGAKSGRMLGVIVARAR